MVGDRPGVGSTSTVSIRVRFERSIPGSCDGSPISVFIFVGSMTCESREKEDDGLNVPR